MTATDVQGALDETVADLLVPDGATLQQVGSTLGVVDGLYAPQVPNLVCFGGHPAVALNGGLGALNVASRAQGSRVIVPKAGTLKDLYIYVGSSSGNIEVGILDTTAVTRNRLWTSGSIPCPASGWQKIGDPNLAVTRGQHLDFYINSDNITASFIRGLSLGASAAAGLPAVFVTSPLGGSPLMAWQGPATTFPLGATLAESSMSPFSVVMSVLARVA